MYTKYIPPTGRVVWIIRPNGIEMRKDTIKEVLNAQPFQPFTVRMADGNAYLVPARDFVSLSPNGRTLVIFGEAGKIKLLDSMLVTEIERVAAT